MIFVDASFYVSLLKPTDSNHDNAVALARKLGRASKLTSQAVLGEVVTVGSQRFSKEATIIFIEHILRGRTTTILFETHELVTRAWKIFKTIKSKNISWVDCYSAAIMEAYKIETVLTFDKDFAWLVKKN